LAIRSGEWLRIVFAAVTVVAFAALVEMIVRARR
jgi:hypothetical protein